VINEVDSLVRVQLSTVMYRLQMINFILYIGCSYLLANNLADLDKVRTH
jgi:hypothetical protein